MNRQPPPGCYRKRLCLKCKVDLLSDGYIVRAERPAVMPGHGTCERCGKKNVLSAIYRYTLSAKGRRERGLSE